MRRTVIKSDGDQLFDRSNGRIGPILASDSLAHFAVAAQQVCSRGIILETLQCASFFLIHSPADEELF